jgi:hypothetical protein
MHEEYDEKELRDKVGYLESEVQELQQEIRRLETESEARMSEIRRLRGIVKSHDVQDTALYFRNPQHRSFYGEHCAGADEYHQALYYLFGLTSDMREHITALFDQDKDEILTDALYAGWQTSGTIPITRLAFNLFTDIIPVENTTDVANYAPAALFSSEFAPYFVQAIKLRFPNLFD